MTTTQTPTGSPPTIILAPNSVEASIDQSDKITVAWEAVAGAISYKVYSATTDDPVATLLASGLTGTSYDDSTASIETFTFYWVVVVTAAGTSDFSGMATGWRFSAIPDAPEDLSASTDDSGQIDLAWSESARALFYQIWRSETDDPDDATLIGQTADTDYSDADIEAGTSHYYFVKAGNYSGYSAFSDSAEGYAAGLPTPTGLTVTDENYDYISLAWDAVDGATTYSVYKEDSLIASGLTDASFEDDEADPGLTRHYKVSASNAFEETAKSSAVTARRVKLDPPSVSASTDLAAQITVSWDDVDGATSYSIEIDGSNYASSVTSPHNITDLDACTNYSVVVHAIREVGDGNNDSRNSPVTGRMEPSGSICSGGGVSHSGGDDFSNDYEFCGGSFDIYFNAESIKDRIKVYVNGSVVFDSGCISGDLTHTVTTGAGEHTITIEVLADCESVGGTSWSFAVSC